MENNSSIDGQKNSNELFGRSKIAKVKTIPMSDEYSDEKINLMLKSGWKILDSYKLNYEEGSFLYYVLGHEDFDAQIPLTKRKIDTQFKTIDEYKLPEESDKDIRTLCANADW